MNLFAQERKYGGRAVMRLRLRKEFKRRQGSIDQTQDGASGTKQGLLRNLVAVTRGETQYP
jgi:hypothetical protein